MSRSPRYAVDPAGEPRNLLTPRHLTKQEFGRRLYQLMLAKNWSQADLARRAELGRDSISTYINGKTFPDPLSRKKLADALGVSEIGRAPSELQSLMRISYAVFCLKKKTYRSTTASHDNRTPVKRTLHNINLQT